MFLTNFNGAIILREYIRSGTHNEEEFCISRTKIIDIFSFWLNHETSCISNLKRPLLKTRWEMIKQ